MNPDREGGPFGICLKPSKKNSKGSHTAEPRVNRIPPPQDVCILIPETLHDKESFADMIKGVEMGRLSCIIQVGPVQSQSPYKREAEGSERDT